MANGQRSLGLFSGLRAFLGGIGFVFGTPSVWGYAAVPLAMVLLLTCGLGSLGVWGAMRASDAIFASSDGLWAHLGSWLTTAVLALAGIIAAIVLAICLAQPFSCFALEAIASAREKSLTGHSAPLPGIFESAVRGMQIAIVTLAVAVLAFGGLFLISFFFPPALVVTVPLKFLVYAWLLAWTFLDYPLAIQRLGVLARIRWVMRHFDAFCAFGLAWAALAIVPGVVLLLLPMGVAGATQMVVEADAGTAKREDPPTP